MLGRISNAGIAIGIVLIVIGGVILWFWLGSTDMGEMSAEEAAETEQLTGTEDEAALAGENEAGEEGAE